MTKLTPRVFDFIDDYVQELAERDNLLTDLDEEESLVVFVREFFIQFFSEIFHYQIQSFDDTSAIDIAVVDKERDAEPHTDAIVAAFRMFCQDYKTIIGEHYDRGNERSRFQREFVPSLLDDIRRWAYKRPDIAQPATHALTLMSDALAKVSDPE